MSEEPNKSKSGPAKLTPEQLEARRAYQRAWNKAHREEVNEYQRAWRAAHRDTARATQKRYRDSHREEIKERNAQYRAKAKAAAAGEIPAAAQDTESED